MAMIRRKFLGFTAAVLGGGALGLWAFRSSVGRRIANKIRTLVHPPAVLSSDDGREEAVLPEAGPSVSVETALNSRCTSDADDNPENFHWGMFDRKRTLSRGQIEAIVSRVRIPRWTDGGLRIKAEKNLLTFIIDNRAAGRVREWLMVESGLEQQALGLVCAALGVGYVFSTLGEDGISLSAEEQATVRIRIDAMKPSYDGAYWTSAAPPRPRPWKPGNLPDPIRSGDRALLTVLADLKTERPEGGAVSPARLGQLLWAARGRTPHFFKSDPWGLTIPTYRGEQALSHVHVAAGDRLSRYVNRADNRPTHSLADAGEIPAGGVKDLAGRFGPGRLYIILGKSETAARALWEIGYQLLNLMLQAASLGLTYKAVLVDDKALFRGTELTDPVAVLVLQGEA